MAEVKHTLRSDGPLATGRIACVDPSAAFPSKRQDPPHGGCGRRVSEPRIQSIDQSIPLEGSIHRVDKECIHDQNMAGLIEGAHHAPYECIGQIHRCDDFSLETAKSGVARVRRRSRRKTKLLEARFKGTGGSPSFADLTQIRSKQYESKGRKASAGVASGKDESE